MKIYRVKKIMAREIDGTRRNGKGSIISNYKTVIKYLITSEDGREFSKYSGTSKASYSQWKKRMIAKGHKITLVVVKGSKITLKTNTLKLQVTLE